MNQTTRNPAKVMSVVEVLNRLGKGGAIEPLLIA